MGKIILGILGAIALVVFIITVISQYQLEEEMAQSHTQWQALDRQTKELKADLAEAKDKLTVARMDGDQIFFKVALLVESLETNALALRLLQTNVLEHYALLTSTCVGLEIVATNTVAVRDRLTVFQQQTDNNWVTVARAFQFLQDSNQISLRRP